MKRISFSIIGTFVRAIVLITASPALADNGPHGGYTALTDACAGCHRAHTAAASRLLVQNVPQLCYSCHGNTGAGADTNVVDGIYLERDSVVEAPPEGVANRGLKGGGFTSALMDTDYDGLAAPVSVSSNHLADGSTGTAWGNGAIGSGAGALNFALSCVSCHDPHGRASTTRGPTYRLLRATPINSGAPSGVNVADQAAKYYVVADVDNQYFGENYGARGTSLSAWCSQCHTRYLAGAGSGNTNSGDPIFAYRHMSNAASVNCVTCHVAHGTAASMGFYSGAVRWPDGSTAPNGDNRSSLLRVDNRGVCELCHMK